MTKPRKPISWIGPKIPKPRKPEPTTKVSEPRDKHLKGRCSAGEKDDDIHFVLAEPITHEIDPDSPRNIRRWEKTSSWSNQPEYKMVLEWIGDSKRRKMYWETMSYIDRNVLCSNIRFAIARTSAIKDKEWSAVLLRDVEHFKEQARASGVKEGILIAQSTKPEDFCSHPKCCSKKKRR